MFRKIRKFMALPAADRLLLTKIGLIVPLVELGIRTLGFKRSFNILKFFVKNAVTPDENASQIIDRHQYFLYLFTNQMPFAGNCLARSLTLWLLLKNKGIETDLRFGMKKENQKLLAHAWLEYNGKSLASDAETGEHYSFFSESILTELVK